MNRKGAWLAIAAGVLLLAGCSSGTKPVFPHHYALSENAVTPKTGASARPGAPARLGTLQIGRIAVAPWLEGTGLYYRLDYRHDQGIASYSQSDWVAPPARMLEQLLRATLADNAGWQAVIGPGTTANAAFTLDIRLDDFSQDFATPERSHGVLDAVATLIDNHDDNAVAQKHFHIEVAAPSANAAGGVKALNDAAQQFAGKLREWLQANAPSAVKHDDREGGRSR